MPTASYQSPNDYNLVREIRPFNLPYESTMQEITAKTNYWKVGADRMKSAYDQAVGLDPQFVQNRDYLNNFMSEANKQLGKISKTDLSVLDNSQQAVNVFKPLYDVSNPFNYRLLEDSQINKHYQKQQQISDSYRTKDGGKEWNQNNDFYFRDAQQKYLDDAKKGNLESIDSHFQNKKSYIPFYDFKKEILEIQEACKGQSYTTKGIAGNNELYFNESSKKGCSPAELSLALKSGLSDRARQQMQIDGYAHFKGNEETLAKQFADISVNNLKSQVDAIKATITSIKDGGVSKEEKEKLAYYESQLTQLEPELKSAIEEFQEMTKGNVIEYVKKNYDRLAGQVYFNDLTNNLANSFRTDDTKNLVTTNAAGMLKLKLETDRANMYIKDNMDAQADYRNHGYRMEEIALQGQNAKELAVLKGEITNPNATSIPQPSRPVTSDTPDIPKVTESDFIKSTLEPAKQKATDTYEVLNAYVAKALGKVNQHLGHQELVNYVEQQKQKRDKNQPYNEDIISAFEKYKEAKDNLAFANDKMASINSAIKANNPELFNDSNLSDKQVLVNRIALTNNNGVYIYKNDKSISEKEAYRVLNGENVKGFEIRKPGSGGSMQLYLDGKLIDPNQSASNTKLYNIFRDIQLNRQVKLDELKTKMYTDNSNYVNSEQTVFNRGDLGKKEFFEANYGDKLKQYMNVTGNLGEKNGYEIIGRDKTGEGVYVRALDDEGKSIDLSAKGADSLFARLRNSPVGYGVKKDTKTNSYYIPNVLPRYSGLPDDATLKKYDKIKEHIRFIETGLKTNPVFINSPVFDSKELSSGGTSRFVSKIGIEYVISVKKEKGQPLTYVATYMNTGANQEREIKAPSMDQLLAQIDPQIK